MTGIERLSEVVRELGRFSFCYDLYVRLSDIADQIEREQDAKVADSTYDALPQEDRYAIAWVREHGGVERVKQQRYESIPRAAYERKRRALLGHIAECETALGKRREAIARLADENDALRLERAQMRPLLMPEGMEWPRFEDGEPVRFLDDFERYGDENGVSAVTMYSDGSFALNCRAYSKGEHVKRPDFHNSTKVNARLTSHSPAPATNVLDADGAEIGVGDDLYSVEGMLKFHVSAIDKKSGRIATEAMFALDKWADPTMYTHRAPVLAADGKPLREGEHVWHVETGTELVVKELPKPGAYQAVVVFAPPASHLTSFDPDQLTHERPVNHCFECSHWQAEPGRDRLGVCWDTYGERECEDSYAAVLGTSEACAQFERRAKALAERGA